MESSTSPLRDWFELDDSVAARVLSELSPADATLSDLYFQRTVATSIKLEDGIVSQASTSVDLGVGLRTVVVDQVGYAFTEDLTEASMLEAAKSARAIATSSRSKEALALRVGPAGRSYYNAREPWSAVSVEARLPFIRRAEAIARSLDTAVKKVTVSWADSEEWVAIVGHDGKIRADRRPMARMFVTITAEKNGQTQSHSSNIAARAGLEWLNEERIAKVAKEAVDRTMLLFEAKRPPAGELPVILAAGASGILLHEAIGHGLEADFNRKGTSIYSNMLGKRIAPEFVNIIDSGTLDGERGALNFDDEGADTEETVLVEGGILRTYLHDSISAAHYKTKPTGSGRRESFRHVPMPRMRCTYMDNGPHTREEIIASVKGTGIIAETFTNGQVQIGAGDFTFYIKNGWLIENGKVTAPIKDTNIIGNGPEALQRVTMAANDKKLDTGGWTCGKNGQGVPVSQGLPTILVSKMTVGGDSAKRT